MTNLTIREMAALQYAFSILDAVANGLMHIPKFQSDDGQEWNGAGKVLDGLCEVLANYSKVLATAIAEREPSGYWDEFDKAESLFRSFEWNEPDLLVERAKAVAAIQQQQVA